jgi:RNA polymerase sigma factor (sigma-70 family)
MTRMIRSIARYLNARSIEASSLEDSAALARFASIGDPRAFEVLVHRYQAMVVHTCRRVMASQADAEDAAQETFLKLARRAGDVRSNVAAWLHACALRTSIDLLRARSTRHRAEAGVAGSESHEEDDRSWAEIKPLLDEAIAALHESDRELIVLRFLAGRTQIELAKEAGVNPGTMHRRIDASLGRLRIELDRRGVSSMVVAGAGSAAGLVSLEAVLAHAAGHGVQQSTTTSLVSIGLAEMGKAGAPGAAAFGGFGIATVIAASVVGIVGVVGVGAIGGYWFVARPAPVFTGVALAAPAATVSGGFDRPTKESERFPLIAMVSADRSGGSMMHIGDEIRLEFPSKKNEGKQESIVVRVKEVKAGSDPIEARVFVESTTLPGDNPLHRIIGFMRDVKIRIDGEHVRFELVTNWTPTEEDKKADRSLPAVIVWTGGRADAVSEAGRAKAASSAIPAFAGKWNWVEAWSLRFDPDNIFLTSKDDDGHEHSAFRFRIIDWENVGSHCRVQAIVSESSRENSMVGKRVKMFIRRNPEGYSIALNESHAKALNEWPAGFDARAGEGLLLLKFRGSEQ